MASLIGFGIPFLQNFLFAILLLEDSYGQLVFFISLFGMLSAFFGFGIGSLIQRYYYDKAKKTLLQEAYGFWLVCALPLSLVFSLIGGFYYTFYESAPFSFPFFLLIILSSFFFSINLTFLNFYIVDKKPIKYALHLIIGRLLLFLSLLFVYFFLEKEISNYIVAYFVASLLIFILTLSDFKINPFKRTVNKTNKEFFKFSYPLMINSVGTLGYSHGYKVLLKLFLSFTELGIFNIAMTLASSFYLVSSSLLKGYIPNAFEFLKQNPEKRNIVFYRNKIFIISVISVILFIPLTYVFLSYFKEGAYIEAVYVIPILLVAQILLLFYGERNLVMIFHKKTYMVTISVVVGSIISALCLFLSLSLKNSIIYAALPILIGYSFQYGIATKLSKKI